MVWRVGGCRLKVGALDGTETGGGVDPGAMPYSLLRRLCAEPMPVKLVKKSDIDKVATLKDAGLVVADIPAVLWLDGLTVYAGAAIVHEITAKGRSATKAHDLT